MFVSHNQQHSAARPEYEARRNLNTTTANRTNNSAVKFWKTHTWALTVGHTTEDWKDRCTSLAIYFAGLVAQVVFSLS